jgi:Asp-tRNA(Asn)/Glu-tRNA(Gln) amidotransferase A subunit family amidase
LTLKKASELLRSQAASPIQLTQACLKRIERCNYSTLNAWITVTSKL